MSPILRIAVADDEIDMREYFQKILPRMGYQVVSVAENGRELVEQCRDLEPDLVISDICMPEMDGIEAAIEIYARRPVPVILFSAFQDHELIERVAGDHITACLVKPIKRADLQPAIALAMKRFRHLEAVKQEAADLRRVIEEGKIAERAEGS